MGFPGLNNNLAFLGIFILILSVLMIIFADKISKRRAIEIRGVGIAFLILDFLFMVLSIFIRVF